MCFPRDVRDKPVLLISAPTLCHFLVSPRRRLDGEQSGLDGLLSQHDDKPLDVFIAFFAEDGGGELVDFEAGGAGSGFDVA